MNTFLGFFIILLHPSFDIQLNVITLSNKEVANPSKLYASDLSD